MDNNMFADFMIQQTLAIALEDRTLPDEYQLFFHWPASTVWHLFGEFSSEGGEVVRS